MHEEEEEKWHEIYLGELDLVLELVEAVVEAAEAVDILLVLPRHLRLRAVPLRNQSPSATTNQARVDTKENRANCRQD